MLFPTETAQLDPTFPSARKRLEPRRSATARVAAPAREEKEMLPALEKEMPQLHMSEGNSLPTPFVASLLLVAIPAAPFVASLLLVARPGATVFGPPLTIKK